MRLAVEWLPESGDGLILVAKVYVSTGAILRRHIGDIHFNGNEWMFIRVARDGKQVMDGFHYIPVDPDTEAHYRTELAKLSAGEDTPDAFVAELNTRRRQHRDSNRELAELGGKMEARRWLRSGYWTVETAADADGRNVLAEAHRQEKRDLGGGVAETEFPCGHRFSGEMGKTCPICTGFCSSCGETVTIRQRGVLGTNGHVYYEHGHALKCPSYRRPCSVAAPSVAPPNLL